MADFRRWITAFAVLALFAGLASAQVGGSGSNGTFVCSSFAVPNTVRFEGVTELVGDIVITCTGGSALNAATVIPTTNIVVSFPSNINVTSRLVASGISEALLIIDEPLTANTAVVAGFGPQAQVNVCGNTSVGAGPSGCVEQVALVAPIGGGPNVQVAVANGTTTPGANVFQGIVSANQVAFNGIPVLPPATAGAVRIFRITNVRVNASAAAANTTLAATVQVGSPSVLPLISNPVAIVGVVQTGLSARLRSPSAGGFSIAQLPQCNDLGSARSPFAVALAEFNENFGTAFKTRVVPTATYNGQFGTGGAAGGGLGNPPAGGGSNLNWIGSGTSSESGTVLNTLGATTLQGTSVTAGLADFGTRLKAVFSNIPSGVRVFVSTVNVSTSATLTAQGVTPPANPSFVSFAQLISGEATADSGGLAPVVTNTGTVSTIPFAEILSDPTTGVRQAVWEVITTNPNLNETFEFAIFLQFSAFGPSPTGATTPAVSLSYAPTTTVFTASASAPIPRFLAGTGSSTLFAINICQTLLLFPFVTTQAGFDTGIAISNTSDDSFGTSTANVTVPGSGTGGVGAGLGTTTQGGSCTMNFFGDAADSTKITNPQLLVDLSPAAVAVPATKPACPNAPTPTGTVPAGCVVPGKTAKQVASVVAPNFVGYMIAVCDFQFAHGFAFISDLGAQKLAMGYLALVMNDNGGALSARGLQSEALKQ